MAHPRKKRRTQPPPNQHATAKPGARPPKSMVIRMGAGEVGTSVSQLTQDFRRMMEPDTASRLKERRANKLKDYTAMAGPLGVTHLFLFSRSKSGNVNLRVALTPRGPTLSFRINDYALAKDIANSQKHPRSGGKEYQSAPLLVMNNFTSDDKDKNHTTRQIESLTTTVFQSIFPPINPQTIPLSSIRRILLLNREHNSADTYTYTLRHYAITTRQTNISKRVRRIDPSLQQNQKKKLRPLPNLGQLEDAADYLLSPSGAGYTSASDTELDTDAEIEVIETTTTKILSRKQRDKLHAQRLAEREAQTANPLDADAQDSKPTPKPKPHHNIEKRAVKLTELGPRVSLSLAKIEEGICEGKVMWNAHHSKTKEEEAELEERWEGRRKEKEERRRVQRENVLRKKEARGNTKKNSGVGGTGEEDGVEGEDEDEEEWDSDEEEWDSDEVEDMLEREANGFNDEDSEDEVNDDDEADGMDVDADVDAN